MCNRYTRVISNAHTTIKSLMQNYNHTQYTVDNRVRNNFSVKCFNIEASGIALKAQCYFEIKIFFS